LVHGGWFFQFGARAGWSTAGGFSNYLECGNSFPLFTGNGPACREIFPDEKAAMNRRTPKLCWSTEGVFSNPTRDGLAVIDIAKNRASPVAANWGKSRVFEAIIVVDSGAEFKRSFWATRALGMIDGSLMHDEG
jgi:hypothetical protein